MLRIPGGCGLPSACHPLKIMEEFRFFTTGVTGPSRVIRGLFLSIFHTKEFFVYSSITLPEKVNPVAHGTWYGLVLGRTRESWC